MFLSKDEQKGVEGGVVSNFIAEGQGHLGLLPVGPGLYVSKNWCYSSHKQNTYLRRVVELPQYLICRVNINKTTMATGTMKKRVEGKDFRFITPDEGGNDLFSFKDAYPGETPEDKKKYMDDLNEGDKVSFDVEQAEKGPRAVSIKRAE